MIVELPMGGNYPKQPHSCLVFEEVGNTTGGLVDGPVYRTIFESLRGVNLVGDVRNGAKPNNYDDFQMDYMVYHDNMHDYSTNEPTMDGTASLTFPLSTYQEEGRQQSNAALDKNVYKDGGIVRTDPSKKTISLVFTAHNRADGAEKIISTLKRYGIKGSFFFTGTFIEMYPDIVKRLRADGHYISTHSNGHLLYMPWENPDSLLISKDEFTTDILKGYEALQKVGINKNDAPYFIPPYEYYNSTISSWAKELGLQVINFSAGTGTSDDYTTPDMVGKYRSSKQLWNQLMKCEKTDKNGLNGQILMVHFGTESSRTDKFYDMLPKIISTLQKKGYTFTSVDKSIALNIK